SVGYTTSLRGTDLRAPSARFRALLDALADPQPLLLAVQPGRRPGILARRAVLGGAQAAARRRSARAPGDRTLDRKKHRAVTQLRHRTDALRPLVPRRRRRPYRATDRRQGT